MYSSIKKSVIVALGLILQILFSVFIIWYFYKNLIGVQILIRVLSIIIVLNIIKNSKSIINELGWIILILLTPVYGTITYLVLGSNKSSSKTLHKLKNSEHLIPAYLHQNIEVTQKLDTLHKDKLRYFNNFLHYPVSTNNHITYFPLGDDFYPAFLQDLNNAREFIFMEYFIINPNGQMWNGILEILKQKVQEGVIVRVMYDDAGSIFKLPTTYKKELESYGIECVVFNELKTTRGIFMNNRDHRKITVIDGYVGYTGGVNLSDEYININAPFGHWKDNAIRITGDGVWNLTLLFLTSWDVYNPEDEDFTVYRRKFSNDCFTGYAVPYGSSPISSCLEGEDAYLNVINQASNYVYIMTPYLIIDTDMSNALILAKKRGVDVRIVVPGIPDKKITYSLGKSYMKLMVDNGIEVLTYTPGFVHSKVFVSDDTVAIVGTINLDYRSLYLHFENGIYMEDMAVIEDIKKDMIQTIAKSHVLSKQEVRFSYIKGFWHSILRILAPLF